MGNVSPKLKGQYSKVQLLESCVQISFLIFKNRFTKTENELQGSVCFPKEKFFSREIESILDQDAHKLRRVIY